MKYKKLTIVPLDFETFFSTHYTLSKLDTPVYVNHPEFKIHGVAIDDEYYEDITEITKVINAIDWNNSALLCHNTAFDGYILTQVFGVTPAYYLDTLSMARPLFQNVLKSLGLDSISKFLGQAGKTSDILERTKGIRDLNPEDSEEMGEYCLDDVSEMIGIFKIMLRHITPFEMDLIDMTIRMFAEPKFIADVPRIQREIKRIEDEKNELFNQAGLLMEGVEGEDIAKTLRSADKFANVLRKNGCEPPTKISPRTGKEAFAFARTDLGFTKLDTHSNEGIRLLRRARLLSKSDTAYNKARKLLAYSSFGKIPAFLNYAKAVTLRWSGKELQMQNMNRGGEMRRSLCAPDGSQIIVMDSGQIECRMLAWLAGQQDILDIFIAKGDVYKEMAKKIYNKETKDINKNERFVGKVAILGLGYSMSAPKFQLVLAQGAMGPPVDLPLNECKKVVNVYRNTNSKIVELWQLANRWLHAIAINTTYTTPDYKGLRFEQGKVWTHKGMFLNYNELKYDGVTQSFTYLGANGLQKHIYGALLVENIVQHLARNLIAEQTLNCQKVMPILLSVHDEAVAMIPTPFAEHAEKYMYDEFITAPDWCPDIPLSAEGGYAQNYSK